MATPPYSEGLFFSSSPTRYTSGGPLEEVDAILAQARAVHQLDPAYDEIISANRRAFFETFSRRVELIKSRSQAFADCHITVFDKVLLELTENGNQLSNSAAVTYFCEEHLSMPGRATPAQQNVILAEAPLVPGTMTQAISPPITQRGSISTKNTPSRSPEKRSLPDVPIHDTNDQVLESLAANVGALMSRLFMVYENAKKDFFAISDPNSLEKQNAAKFLRDTCENALQHLQDKAADKCLVAELTQTWQVAKHTAMTLHGGKKRKFDQSEHALSSSRPIQPERIEVFRANERHIKRTNASCDRAASNDFPGHTRAFDTRKRAGHTETTIRENHQFYAPDPPTPRRPRNPGHKRQPGRGHSGIPFGYTRPVDSYCPR